jgi:hypothetical protein
MDLVARTLLAAAARASVGDRLALRARGVVPTPGALARHAVARVDALLRTELGLEDGLASEHVVVVDPAVGTGVWLAALLEQTRTRGARSLLLGFDSDAAALTTADELLAAEARRQGVTLRLSCENTLELAAPFPDQTRVRVILGNPPWAARSRARGGALSDAWLAEFRRDHRGVSLGERRVGVLSDDYVRFFRWALEHARQAPAGALVCFVTNASFLDGPVHRGMRAALLGGFDKLELLDLGGNALLSRADGALPDDNVFGVRVGAALTWALRRPAASRARCPVSVSFASLRGTLAEKLSALDTEELALAALRPSAPWFGFRPHVRSEAEHGFSLAEAFVFQREGVQTNRDAIAIASTREELEARVRQLAAHGLSLPSQRHFDAARARRLLQEALERGEPCVAPLAYRPLDARFFITLAPLCHRPRSELLRASAASSLSLLAVRKDRGAAAFNLFAVASGAVDACFLSTRSSCRTRVFPSHQPDGAENLSVSVATQLAARVGRVVSAHELIVYALSVLGAPRFRARQQAALQRDYARLPWPRDARHFDEAQLVGARFVSALNTSEAAPVRTTRLGALEGPLAPRALQYRAEARTVWSGELPVLSGVEPAWWSARVGHHALVASPAACASLAGLEDALARAALWSEAERAADALYSAHESQAGTAAVDAGTAGRTGSWAGTVGD